MNELFEKMMVPCHMIDKVTSNGPFGVTTVYKDGAAFKAAVVLDRSLQARVAAHEGVTQVYTVTAPPEVQLDFHDHFRRDSDGATFQVTTTTADSNTPTAASFQFVQVNAERWEIPNA